MDHWRNKGENFKIPCISEDDSATFPDICEAEVVQKRVFTSMNLLLNSKTYF